MRSGPLILLALFASAITAAWAWFNTAPQSDANLIWIQTSTNIPGYSFTPEPLSKAALEILGTPEYINGTFTPLDAGNDSSDQDQVIRIFAATWSASSKQGMTVVQHTPDVCWVGVGWTPIDAGQPKQVELEIPIATAENNRDSDLPGTVKIPFECRVFRSPDGRSQELVIWCTLVSGRVLPEQSRFEPQKADSHESSNKERQLAAGRRLSAGYFAESFKQRIGGRGTKQFMRLSAQADRETSAALEHLTITGPRFLQARSRKEDS
jgi:hypothetical protein